MARRPVKDPYKVLGVPRTADGETIKRAYRKRSKETHPDAGGSDEAFHDVAAAAKLLSDPVKRLTYDRTGEADDVTQTDDAHAITMIAGLLDQFLAESEAAGTETWTTDIVVVLRNSLEQSSIGADKIIAAMKKDIARKRKLAKKFTAKKGQPLLRGMIERKIVNLESSIVLAEMKKRFIARALELLKDEAFEVDRAAPPQANLSPMMRFALSLGGTGTT